MEGTRDNIQRDLPSSNLGHLELEHAISRDREQAGGTSRRNTGRHRRHRDTQATAHVATMSAAASLLACGIVLLHLSSLLASCQGYSVRFLGVAIYEPLPTNVYSAAFLTVFPPSPIEKVQQLFSLQPNEIEDLKDDLVAFLNSNFSITLDPAVQLALSSTQPISIQPAGNAFAAHPATSGPFNAVRTPFIRDPVLMPTKLFPKTYNATIDGDEFTLAEGGYSLLPTADLNLGPEIGLIPNGTFLSDSLLQWIGDKTGIKFRIKSSRTMPLPPGESIVFDAAGYPGSEYVSLLPGQVQAAYSIVPTSGSYRVRWTTTESHPGFTE